ncbi:beta-aspartyl-peptidase [Alteromonas sp. ASW11-36]|uniref:Isoaspartyl dipeptidase n=1 Tax=Alteromonas arenosi TaxID=3055817 RepID=A0ABT7STT5_9ALTE|nr:beta-aspartyl-peptidase [Alteromonas sp. ASW11-36]MDM7859590.1 beta-aspartyl-peptidase [Alteromonas sp. ASW11-36]
MSLFLIKGAQVYVPESLGRMDVLVGGGKVLAIDAQLAVDMPNLHTIDATGQVLIPGFVDPLAHISGGGGEGGFTSRTPALNFDDAVKAGVTTMVAALGTDAITRSLEDMLATAKAINEYGLNAYIYTGNYHLPAVTLTGSVSKDIMLISECIGVGEVAISDHRSSQPTMQQLAELAAQARVGGMLSGKAGVVFIHVGPSDTHLSLLQSVVSESDIPIAQFHPTHMNRDQALLDAGIAWTQTGGSIDFTASTNEHFIAEGEIPAAQAVAIALEQGVAAEQMTISTDANASLPVFDDKGDLIGLELGDIASLHEAFQQLVLEHNVDISHAVQVCSTSAAKILGLPAGSITLGDNADLVLLDQRDLSITSVFAKGRCLMLNQQLQVKAPF